MMERRDSPTIWPTSRRAELMEQEHTWGKNVISVWTWMFKKVDDLKSDLCTVADSEFFKNFLYQGGVRSTVSGVLKVLNYSRNFSLHATLIPNLAKPLNMYRISAIIVSAETILFWIWPYLLYPLTFTS